MFAIEEDLDKKLWLYAIHVGKDRSEVVNDLLRPVVASMVLYDSRDRRGRNAEPASDRGEARRVGRLTGGPARDDDPSDRAGGVWTRELAATHRSRYNA